MSTQTPDQQADRLMPEVPARRLRQVMIGAAMAALALCLAVACIYLTIKRQDERNQATDVALELCDQVTDVGQNCRRDPRTLPWADTDQPHAAASGVAPALQPLPPRYAGNPTNAPGPADVGSAAQAAIPAADAAVTTIEVVGGRLVLTYADGSRVDAGPVTGDLVSILRSSPSPTPHPSSTPSRPPSPSVEPSAPQSDESGTPGVSGTTTDPTPSGGPS